MTMFDALQGKMKQAQLIMRLMKDEHFRALIGHPKVQTLLNDPEFLQLIQSQDLAKITAHPKLAAIFRDPELAALLSRIDPKQFLPDAA